MFNMEHRCKRRSRVECMICLFSLQIRRPKLEARYLVGGCIDFERGLPGELLSGVYGDLNCAVSPIHLDDTEFSC